MIWLFGETTGGVVEGTDGSFALINRSSEITSSSFWLTAGSLLRRDLRDSISEDLYRLWPPFVRREEIRPKTSHLLRVSGEIPKIRLALEMGIGLVFGPPSPRLRGTSRLLFILAGSVLGRFSGENPTRLS